MATEQVTFHELVRRATGFAPYDYQQLLAESGPPEVLEVPTGSGKTLAAILPWLYRRRFHPDAETRTSTPRRLVYVLPMRVLVEQTTSAVRTWLDRLSLTDDVHLQVLMGGEPRRAVWRTRPEDDAIVIGTLDMILSRALNRGYGENRPVWPIDFGLLNADCHYVYDEVQLMGQALATSRQLDGLRKALGTAGPATSMWMSATVPTARLQTIDAPHVPPSMTVTERDRSDPELGQRLHGERTIQEILHVDPKKTDRSIAAAAVSNHRRGTLTIVVLNTVDQARAVHKAVRATKPDAQVVLLHSRFRPPERAAVVDTVLSAVDPAGPGLILVSTQVVEAGVDLDAATLVTEAAPWSSIVQRAGRCNRSGRINDAVILWTPPARPAPYESADVEAAVLELRRIEGMTVNPEQLGQTSVPGIDPIVPVLRRRDLLQLFDTQPDLSGNDVDVSRFIRDPDELTVAVAWRQLPDGPGPAEKQPGRDERCPAPVSEVRKVLDEARRAWRWSYLERKWERCFHSDVRPGDVLLVDVRFGCYTPEGGWDRRARPAVPPIPAEPDPNAAEQAEDDDDDSFQRSWLPLTQHLEEVRDASQELLLELDTDGLPPGAAEAAIMAAYLHDVGKAHPAFQGMLRSSAAASDEPPQGLLAKSNGARGHYEDRGRRYFRHEVASALALLGDWHPLISHLAEPGLATYLVCSHHGKARMGIRSMPDENEGSVLGVRHGDQLPEIRGLTEAIGPATLSLEPTALGGEQSWLALTTLLRDRPDLGPFRLSFLEAIVRLADWRASGPVRLPDATEHGAAPR